MNHGTHDLLMTLIADDRPAVQSKCRLNDVKELENEFTFQRHQLGMTSPPCDRHALTRSSS